MGFVVSNIGDIYGSNNNGGGGSGTGDLFLKFKTKGDGIIEGIIPANSIVKFLTIKGAVNTMSIGTTADNSLLANNVPEDESIGQVGFTAPFVFTAVDMEVRCFVTTFDTGSSYDVTIVYQTIP